MTGGLPATGLAEVEAARRLQSDGRNEITLRRHDSLRRTITRQLTDAVVLVLLAAATLTAAVGDATDTAVILAVIVLNTALGVSQEVRSGRALDALAELTAPHASVVRDGCRREIDAAEVVVGDLLELTAGDIVPADARVESGENLHVDESTVTGESEPVVKARNDLLHASTVVTVGRGRASVTAIADSTVVGRIARSLEARAIRTPVQRQLAVLGKRLAIAAAGAAVVVGALNLATGHGAEASAVLAISLAVAAIPESLPAVVSLGLALAARRLSAAGILVRRLPAVEALGSVTVIAADKTGTLTENRMSVQAIWTPARTSHAERRLLEAAVLCNDADSHLGQAVRHDDPLEVALVSAAAERGVDATALRTSWPRIAEVPFDAATRRMATTHAGPDGQSVEYCKGSPEALLCPSDPSAEVARQLAEQGHRVIAVTALTGGTVEVLGLIALRDPPRDTARAVVAAFRAAGVRPVMITGDHLGTALAIADAVGLPHEDVHARVLPDDKRAIVTALRDGGQVVAMTGDGVNDAPALRAADIGVAMGARATEVARQAAGIVLTRDDLGAMVSALREGRRMYDNLRRFLHYALSGGLAEIVVMLAGPAFGFAVPLQAGQLLWVNLLTHGLPGVAMGNEAAASDVLRRPPRPPAEQLLDRSTLRRVAVLGTTIALACLGAAAFARHTGHPWQSVVFLTLGLSQLAAALALRPCGAGRGTNRMLTGAVVLNVALAVLAVTWRPLRELLHTTTLDLPEMLACALAASVPAAAARLQAARASLRVTDKDDGAPRVG